MTASGKTRHIATPMTFQLAIHLIIPTIELPPSFRLIMCFPLEIQRFVYDHAPPIKIEKLRPEGVAMYAYGVSVRYKYLPIPPI